jgi:hypothetical protein
MMYYLLQEGPAETTGFMIAGYAVVFGVMLVYLISLYVRRRNLKQDMEVLQELEEGSGGARERRRRRRLGAGEIGRLED